MDEIAVRLDRNVERVKEEVVGEESASLIVRVANTQPGMHVLETASRALRSRGLAITARDCLPEDRARTKTATRATPAPQLRTDADALESSMSVQAHPTTAKFNIGDLKAAAVDGLRPVLDHELGESELESSRDSTREGLWASNSVALTIPVVGIDDLVRSVPEIVEVHVNRRLRVPPVAEVRNIPEAVRETRIASWGLQATGALATWGAYGARGAGSKVAILDTGVDATHPDLQGKVAAWAEFDRDGRLISDNIADAHDVDRHGTHVAGAIAGDRASGQWIGVAPEARLYCARVLDAGGGTDAQIQAGMSWAVEQGVDVISMSLGGLSLSPEMPATYTAAIVTCLQSGIPVVVAIGNDGSQTTGSPGSDVFALGVGATAPDDRPAGFSGGRTHVIYSSEFVAPEILPLPYSKPDMSAPGVAVVSSVPGGDWVALSGTSMATPHVAGALALLLSATNIRATVSQAERAFVLQDLLIGSVEELGESGQDHRYGFGRLDVLRAIGFAADRGYV